MTDWSWEMQERSEQKKLFEDHRENKAAFDSEYAKNKRFELKEKQVKASKISTPYIKLTLT